MKGNIPKKIAGSFVILLFLGMVSRGQGKSEFLPCAEMPEIMGQYEADYTALTRIYTIDKSPEKRERFRELLNSYLGRLHKIPFTSLSQGCRVDYILFQRDLNDQLYAADLEKKEVDSLQKWFPFADSVYTLEKMRRRGAQVDGKEVAGMFSALRKEIRSLEGQLAGEKTLSLHYGHLGSSIAGGFHAALKSVFDFYNGYDPIFSWWVPETYRKLDTALTDYANLFSSVPEKYAAAHDSGGIAGQPAGREEILRQLKYEMIDYSPEELIQIAEKEFAWCDREMLKASAEMGFGKDWKKALEKVKNSYVPPGGQPQAMMKLYNESLAFLKNHDLITIPPLAEETWRMVMMSPRQQLLNPFFYGGEEFSISYPTNTMDYDDRMMSMRGNNPHFSRATVHHELIAGHYLQQFMCEHYKTYRHFGTPFWTEGWALYWELTLWDQGFPQSPEDRVGMLFWRMHRCARILFSLNYHLGNWTAQRCVDYLVDRVGHERANAEGEVRRSFAGGYPALYQIAYMIGGLEFYALKKELVDKGIMTLKQFHDAVLRENAMPVEMIRALLLKQPLTADYRTDWRFYSLP
jgi:uncharacterized protein (DUF885 family)